MATDLAAVEGTAFMTSSPSSSSPRFNAALATEDAPDLAEAPDLPEADLTDSCLELATEDAPDPTDLCLDGSLAAEDAADTTEDAPVTYLSKRWVKICSYLPQVRALSTSTRTNKMEATRIKVEHYSVRPKFPEC